MNDHDSWTLAARENGIDTPATVRYKPIVNSESFFSTYPHLVQITWNFRHPSGHGLPLHAEAPELDYFEDLMTEWLEAVRVAIVVAVVTLENQRHFYLYAHDLQDFVDQFHLMPQQIEPYPVSIEVTAGDGGACYNEVVANCS